jgi:hypothetical protein
MAARICGFLGALLVAAGAAHGATPAGPGHRRVFFGELHLHTVMSYDAWIFGTQVTPDQAYKFGRGEPIMVPGSQVGLEEGLDPDTPVAAQRAWPLDFMAVTDHAEWMGVFSALEDSANPARSTSLGQEILQHPFRGALALRRLRAGDKSVAAVLNAPAALKSAWDLEMKAANDNYRPGSFTTFIAYEWSAMAESKYNLHRNVIFNGDHAPLPFTSVESTDPEKLWDYLESVRARGIKVLAIPHNGNASNGLMYDWNDAGGRPIDEHYAQRRATNEPLTEIVQSKGQSETTPDLSPSDEFANYEVWDHLINFPDVKSRHDGSYIRQAWGRGLVVESQVGVNPFKFGVVGGSDIHNGLSVSSENAYAGYPYGVDPHTMSPKGDAALRSLDIRPTVFPYRETDSDRPKPHNERLLMMRPGGITAVWAEANTRDSIYAALERKETYATSGTRIRVRMFGGWTFGPSALHDPDWVAHAYARGVSMGADLPLRPAGSGAPRFLLQAIKDPDGANLDRVQVIKVWLEGSGYKERIYDVAMSGGRRDDARGHAPAVGNTVDLKSGAYRNTIGAAVLTADWKDPDFDAAKPAVYYARVLEIPTPRWSTLLAIRNHLPLPASAPATIQERAWTSPIWYAPKGAPRPKA